MNIDNIKTTILSCLYIEEKEFYFSSKREHVDARILFWHFAKATHKGKSYEINTIVEKYLKKAHGTISYYRGLHPVLLKSNKMYRIKFTLLNQYFKMTPLEQLLERLKDLEDHEIGLTGKIAYKLVIAAAESLLDEEQRYIKEQIKKSK
jgi:hypothetical protein